MISALQFHQCSKTPAISVPSSPCRYTQAEKDSPRSSFRKPLGHLSLQITQVIPAAIIYTDSIGVGGFDGSDQLQCITKPKSIDESLAVPIAGPDHPKGEATLGRVIDAFMNQLSCIHICGNGLNTGWGNDGR